ncbi:MAG: amidase [Frankiales bacterium]|nr:amidase [Frankiales bacterium]
MAPAADLSTLNAAQLADSFATGELSSLEITEYLLARIEQHDQRLNSVLAIDGDGARIAARAADDRRRHGQVIGPLDGIPLLVKDNIEVLGLPGTAGSRALLDSPPAADAPLVTRARAAGLVILGAANLSEWANFRSTASTSGWSAVGGQARNPYDPSRNTSGSSSGSAVAVAAGFSPLSVGTETDGSIVSPAGVCGVVGFKPTLGTVPGAGIIPISVHQDIAGPMARTVADAAALYAVLSGQPVAPVRAVALDGLRVGFWVPEDSPDGVSTVFAECLSALRTAGAVPVPGAAAVTSPFADAEFDALVSEFAVELPAYLQARPGNHPKTWDELLAFNRADPIELSLFSDEILQLAAAAAPLTSQSYLTARRTANEANQAALESVLAGCELAIVPTNAPAWPIEYGTADHFWVLTSSICAVTGGPSITVPAGMVNGLPVGVSVLGRPGQDAAVLALGAALEQILPPRAVPKLAPPD